MPGIENEINLTYGSAAFQSRRNRQDKPNKRLQVFLKMGPYRNNN